MHRPVIISTLTSLLPYGGGSRSCWRRQKRSVRSWSKSGLLLANLVVLAAALTIVTGCGPSRVAEDGQQPQVSLVWPSPPEAARIAYLQTIATPKDIGAGRGFFGRLVEVLVGPKFEEIVKPYGVATDSAGRLIVADTALKRVHVFDRSRKKYSFIEKAGSNGFETPIAAAVDGDDNIYITDSTLNRIFVFGRDGRLSNTIETGKRPTGLAIDKAGRKIFVSETGEHRVAVYDLKGNAVTTIGKWGEGPGEFNYPVDLFINGSGELYVVDSMNYRVQIFDRQGKFLTMFGRHGDGSGDFGRPKGIGVDKDGNIYVADALFDTVQIFDREGNYLLSFGKLGRTPGSFWLPSGVNVDSEGKIYVADSYNKRIQVFEYLGSQ